MADHSIMSQVEVLSVTNTGRRRRWTDAEKLRIVQESYAAPRMAAATARRHEISRSLLTRWRREAREGLLAAGGDRAHFAPVAIAAADPSELPCAPLAPVTRLSTAQAQTAEITLVNGRRLSVVTTIDPVALGRLVQVLDRS